MFEKAKTVLIQFLLSAQGSLGPVVREDEEETITDRKAREEQAKATVLVERHGIVPSGLVKVLKEAGLTLVDARSQVRTNGVGKRRMLVTFTFSRDLFVARHRREELAGNGLAALNALLARRWGNARVVAFPGKETLRVAMFTGYVESPRDPRELTDEEATSCGFVITRPRKKKKAA